MLTTTVLQNSRYTIDAIRDDVRHLVQRGMVSPHQPIYTLLHYLPSRDQDSFERELELHEYLLRDRIADLIPQEVWKND